MRRPFDADSDAPADGAFSVPCSDCHVLTRGPDLCGTRCMACHRAWCMRPQPQTIADVILPDATGPLAWAHRLREVELAHGGVKPDGSRLTAFQRDAWRRALKADRT